MGNLLPLMLLLNLVCFSSVIHASPSTESERENISLKNKPEKRKGPDKRDRPKPSGAERSNCDYCEGGCYEETIIIPTWKCCEVRNCLTIATREQIHRELKTDTNSRKPISHQQNVFCFTFFLEAFWHFYKRMCPPVPRQNIDFWFNFLLN